MKKYILFSFVLAAMVFSGCKKENLPVPETADYLIFGIYFGECIGNCSSMFLLSDGKLYADDNVEYGYPDNIPFQDEDLGTGKYEIAKILWDEFPAELLNQGENTFGCPDCADQGGLLIELRLDGETNRWLIDSEITALPEFLQSYAQLAQDIIWELI